MRSWQCVLFVCVACGGKEPKSREDLVKEHGDAIKAKLAAIKAAGTAGLGASDAPSVKTVAGLNFDVNDQANQAAVNALVTMYDDTQDPAADASADRFSGMSDAVRNVKKLLGVKMANEVYESGEPELARFERAKYVLVVYRSTFSAPRQALSGNGFTPGTATSSNVLVELGTNKLLGSYTTEAHSSDTVRAPDVDGHAGATEAYQSYLDSDLREHWGKALADGAEKRWPGTKTPYSF